MGRPVSLSVALAFLVACSGGAVGPVADSTTSSLPQPATTVLVPPTTLVPPTAGAPSSTTTEASTTTTLPLIPPGEVWALVPADEAVFDGAGEQSMLSVAVGGPGLVAVGYDGSGGDYDAAVWVSTDGFAWQRVPHDEAVLGGEYDEVMHGVVAGGPGLVAVGYRSYAPYAQSDVRESDAAVWLSVDGVSWTRVPHDEAAFGGTGLVAMHSVAAAGPGFVAVGDEGFGVGYGKVAAVWTSVDGVAWSRVPHSESTFGGPGENIMLSVASGGPGVVAVGTSTPDGHVDAAVWTSPDGLSWTRVGGHEEVFGGSDLKRMLSVAAAGPGLVAVGCHFMLGADPPVGTAAVWTSPDGAVWGRVSPNPSTFGDRGTPCLHSVVAGGPGVVAVGHDDVFSGGARVWLSNDGISWRRVLLPEELRPWATDDGALVVPAAGAGWYTVEAFNGVIAWGDRMVAVGNGLLGHLETSAVVAVSPG